MEITIKRSTDTEEAFGIAKSLPEYFSEEGLKSIKDDVAKHILFGAYLRNAMVAFATYKELNSEAIEMTWIAVKKEYQDKGIGKKLIKESLKQIGESYKICQTKTLSEIHPDKGYERTRNFYKRLGFVPLETIQPYPGWSKDDPCQIFVKCLRCQDS